MLKKITLLTISVLIILFSISVLYAATKVNLERETVNCQNEGLQDCDKVVGELYKYNIDGPLNDDVRIELPIRNVEIICFDKTDVAIGYYDSENNAWVELKSDVVKLSEGLYKVVALTNHLGYIGVIKNSECTEITCTAGGYELNPTTGQASIGEPLKFKICGLIPNCDTTESGCDANCPQGFDPDCNQTECNNTADSCCLVSKDGACDPDCYELIDTDCCDAKGEYTEEKAKCYCYNNDCYILKFPNGDHIISESLDVPFEFKAIGYGQDVGGSPFITINGATVRGRDILFTQTLQIGENSVWMVSDNDRCDGCGCGCDGIQAKITTKYSNYTFTTAANQLSPYSTEECSNGYIDTVVCGDCCMTSFTTTIEVSQCTNPKTVYLCDEEGFTTTSRGAGKEISNGSCSGKTWCIDEDASRSEGECEYLTEEEYQGINEFNAWFCDTYDCYKTVKGGFQICGGKWNCTSTCFPDECNYESKEWCTKLGVWQTEGWCTSECGKPDSTCVKCEHGVCDANAKKWCKNSYWISNGYCDCDVCGSKDSTCPGCTCTDGECDTVNEKYCESGIWKSDAYCWKGSCCLEDYDCYSQGICNTCTSGTCDLKNNQYCSEGVWTSDNYCQNCELYDADCGTGSCEEGLCDTKARKYCKNGEWMSPGGSYCKPGYCGIQDPDCTIQPCEENWVCNEWGVKCDSVNGEHTCLELEDKNDCNTFFEKPDDTQPCYIEFPCTKDDDKDKDGYPKRACYDVANDVLLDELDCDDSDVAQNPEMEEVCNGEDDNCDDSVDEGCPCVGGATQSCGRNEGGCRSGLQLCIDGYWSVCAGSGYVAPVKEVCDDGLDNNCDGYVDENCNCIEDQKQDCGIEVGVCKKGWQACYNSSFGSMCNDEVKGVTEICNNNLDDDCDSTLDGDDSNCQVTTPVTTGPEHCRNRIQDAGETGVDCGDDKDCSSCTDKPDACSYGKIEEKCTCGAAAYTTGFCCNGKFSLVECIEPVKDSDDDGCNDDKELKLGTDPKNGDTDGDTLLDCDPEEKLPLCNEDGICDVEREYPETLENCPSDCGAKGSSWLIWLLLILIILTLLGVGGYFYAKKKGYKLPDILQKLKLSNFIKMKKKEEKPSFQYGSSRGTPAKQTTPESVKPEKKRDIVKLREFANNALKKGYTKIQVRQSALKAGWSEQEIDGVLKGKKSEYKLFK